MRGHHSTVNKRRHTRKTTLCQKDGAFESRPYITSGSKRGKTTHLYKKSEESKLEGKTSNRRRLYQYFNEIEDQGIVKVSKRNGFLIEEEKSEIKESKTYKNACAQNEGRVLQAYTRNLNT